MLSLCGGFVKGEWGRIKGIAIFLVIMVKMFQKQIDIIVFYDKIKTIYTYYYVCFSAGKNRRVK